MKILLVGKKGCGKSSFLYTLFHKYSCGGIVCVPAFVGDIRIGKDAIDMANNTRTTFCRLKEMANFEGIETENYIIREEAIQFCIEALKNSFSQELIIIDEFGPLEMDDRGLYSIGKKIIENKNNVIISIREKLEEKFLEKFPYQFGRIYIC